MTSVLDPTRLRRKDGLRHTVLPGGLSPADHERIFALAEKGWSALRIAREILKHPGTVAWFMYRHGLKAPGDRVGKPYMRGGRMVRPFSKEEDAFILALRVQDYGPKRIAELVNERFGTERTMHTINCRLIMLAARED